MLGMLAAAGAGAITADLAVPFLISPTTAATSAVPLDKLAIGGTFSPLETEYLELDTIDALRDVLSLKLDYIRLGAYWNRIETREGHFEFDALDALITEAEKAGVPVVLTVGIKAPVWPEFHIPWWVWESESLPPTGLLTRSARLRELAGRFVRTVVERYAEWDAISVLQVENEPFEPILTERGWSLDEPFLRQQVSIARSADKRNRPILLTAYVASSWLVSGAQGMIKRLAGRTVFDAVLGKRPDDVLIDLADIVGLDIYPAIGWSFFGVPTYLRAESDADYAPLLSFRDAAVRAGKQVMIAECQAKPWEPNEKTYRQLETPSFSPTDTPRLVTRLANYGFESIAIWGLEHWVWHHKFGNPDWWNLGQLLVKERRLPTL